MAGDGLALPACCQTVARAVRGLRQPLQACCRVQELLARRAADAETATLVARLEESLTSMAACLDTLCEANRIEAETPPADGSPCRPAPEEAAAAPPPEPQGEEDRTIFVIGADAALGGTVRDLLTKWGWMVELHSSAEAFLATTHPDRTGTLLVDVRMPGMDGLSLLRQLRDQGRQRPVIVMTGHDDMALAVAAVKAGARDFIEKPIRCSDLRAAIGRVRDGDAVAFGGSGAENPFAGLSARQRQVLDLVLTGASSKIIAAQLGIGQRTVESHRAAIMRKAGVKSLAALIQAAVTFG